MNARHGSIEPLSVDISAVSSGAARREVLKAIESVGRAPQASTSYWSAFSRKRGGQDISQSLVVADLYRVAEFFVANEPHDWISAIRQTRSFILACVRTKRDRSCADLVDDIMRLSESRFAVCELTAPTSRSPAARIRFESCVGKAVAALDPEALIEVRYSVTDDVLLVEFGDGLVGSIAAIDLLGEEHDLRLDTAVVSPDFDAIEVLASDGHAFHIDSSSVRAHLDREYASEVLSRDAKASRTSLGDALRQSRVARGLTQSQLADVSGLEQALISKLERGKHQPRYDTLERYAGGLDLSVSDLLSKAAHGA